MGTIEEILEISRQISVRFSKSSLQILKSRVPFKNFVQQRKAVSTRMGHGYSWIFGTSLHLQRRKKPYTTTTERKSLGELFWPQRKTFQAGGEYKSPIKTRKPYLPPKSFLCGTHCFRQRKTPHWSRVVYAF